MRLHGASASSNRSCGCGSVVLVFFNAMLACIVHERDSVGIPGLRVCLSGLAIAAHVHKLLPAGRCSAVASFSKAWAGSRGIAAISNGLDADHHPGSCSEAARAQPKRELPVQWLGRWV